MGPKDAQGFIRPRWRQVTNPLIQHALTEHLSARPTLGSTAHMQALGPQCLLHGRVRSTGSDLRKSTIYLENKKKAGAKKEKKEYR